MKIIAKLSILSAIAISSASVQAAVVPTVFKNETKSPIAIIHGKTIDHVSAKSTKSMDVDTDNKLFVYTNVHDEGEKMPYEVRSNIFRFSKPSKNIKVTFQDNDLGRRDIVVHGGTLRDSDSDTRKVATNDERKAYNKSQVDIFISLQMSRKIYGEHMEQ